MRSVDTEADSIDQAIDAALRTLGVGRDRVEIEILSDATRGLFGFGGTKARVRATVRAPLAATVEPEDGGGTGMVSRETPALEIGGDRTPERTASATVEVTAASQEKCKRILEALLAHIGTTCTVTVRHAADPGSILLEITGDSGGLLIGRRGQTLDALEYLVNRIMSRDEDGAARVMIDVERYRERRSEYLATLARRLADKAKNTGHPVTLNPMTPRDRRLVHIALQDDSGVVTRSQGDGHYRRLVILPADGSRGGRPARSSDRRSSTPRRAR